MFRNPAYQGTACFQKTRRGRRARPREPPPAAARAASGSPGVLRPRPREEWIEIPVPALVTPTQFALAQARLVENRRFAAAHKALAAPGSA